MEEWSEYKGLITIESNNMHISISNHTIKIFEKDNSKLNLDNPFIYKGILLEFYE
jgi:hypothetical protein